ncbi:hypothetical protein F8M41_004315 [Gigaspora margarita]|uniref:Uncharacterized protein n=1 Tax=Gigaspora margarita TaxID=4874 RepID=A0A8H4AXS7_GIGMA|nr:hypothetical protein F8M41_004315 [Gigaspora margarita]
MPISCNNCIILQEQILKITEKLPNTEITICCANCKQRSIKEVSSFIKDKKKNIADSKAFIVIGEEAGPSKKATTTPIATITTTKLTNIL